MLSCSIGTVSWCGRYSARSPGIDDAIAGQIAGSEAVIVGLNGDGGVRRLDSQGKELWQQPDGNVWHVEIATPDNGSDAMILHTNARGQLVLRDATGNVVGHSKPETYVSHFSLTAWDDHPTRNDLIAAGNGSLYILSMHAQTLARLSAPGAAGVDEAKELRFVFRLQIKVTQHWSDILRGHALFSISTTDSND